MYKDTALLNPERRNLTFLPLEPEELPKKGDIVALDAEFISLKEVRYFKKLRFRQSILFRKARVC